MAVTRIADTIYAFRFLRLLTTPWEDTNAYKLGIVDKDGKKLKKPVTREEKAAYNIFHKLVYNIKRLLGKLPLGKTRLASYAAALYLIKEETGLSEEQMEEILDKLGIEFDKDDEITESWMQQGDVLHQGNYILTEDIANPISGELLHRKGTKVSVQENCTPCDILFNTYIYEVTHVPTKQKIYVSVEDIER